jgi:hypothetical protein
VPATAIDGGEALPDAFRTTPIGRRACAFRAGARVAAVAGGTGVHPG